MPGRNGIELIRELRGEYSLRKMVIVTAFPDLAEAAEVLERGAITVIGKPFSVSHLVECVQDTVGTALTLQDGRAVPVSGRTMV